MHMGMQYEEGDKIQPNCSTKCTCHRGDFQCETQTCLTNGTTATCYVYGALHFQTFDAFDYEFQGNCSYIFLQPCNTSKFSITVTTTAHNMYTYTIKQVNITIFNESTQILLVPEGEVTIIVNGMPQINTWHSEEVEVLRVGGYFQILLKAAGINVFWDGKYRLSATVSQMWSGELCGLCGNYNGDSADDFESPDGVSITSASDFSISWQTDQSIQQTCGNYMFDSPPSCPVNITAEAEAKCNAFLVEQFAVCNRIVDPMSFIDDCYYDYCFCNEENHQNCFCNSLSTYISICTSHGIVLPTSAFRELNCCKFCRNMHWHYCVVFINT